MTEQTDIDRLLETWFDDGPTVMPDRVVTVVADRIGRQAQRRPRRRDRRPRVNLFLKVALAAALGAAVFGGAALLGGGRNGPPPSTPAPVPSTSPPTAPSPSIGAKHGADGLMEPGTYTTEELDVRLDPDQMSQWTGELGVLTYTVPAGWAGAGDDQSQFTLWPFNDFDQMVSSGGGEYSLRVFARPSAVLQRADCPAELEPSVGRSPDELVTWIRSVPGITSTEPADITVDGHPGRFTDVRLAPGWTKSCPWADGKAIVPLVIEATPDSSYGRFGPAGTQVMRMIFVDLGQGDTVLINVTAEDPARFADLVQSALPIINSFRFK